MKVNLNFSTGNITEDCSLTDWLSSLSKLSTNSIELGFTIAERIPNEFNRDVIELLKKFGNVFVHAPVKVDDDWCIYPSPTMDKYIDMILNLQSLVDIKSVLFHPDLVKDFEYLNKKFGDKLSFENMDIKKKFGKTIEEMEIVFNKSPQANWVCDVNHLYTLDKTLSNASIFHKHFSNRLIYYHLSAYGGFHSLFVETHEDIILNGLVDFTKPVIHEGFSQIDAINKLPLEIAYIKSQRN